MNTKVVNIKKRGVKYDVYVGRAGKGMDGTFGNPVKAGEKCNLCGLLHIYKDETLVCFERYFRHRLSYDRAFYAKVLALKGKTLGCFCDGLCHGKIIAKILDTELE